MVTTVTISLLQAPSIKMDLSDIFSLSSFLLFEILSNSFSSTPFLMARRANLIVGGSYRSHHHRLQTKLYFVSHQWWPLLPQLQLDPTSTRFCTNNKRHQDCHGEPGWSDLINFHLIFSLDPSQPRSWDLTDEKNKILQPMPMWIHLRWHLDCKPMSVHRLI